MYFNRFHLCMFYVHLCEFSVGLCTRKCRARGGQRCQIPGAVGEGGCELTDVGAGTYAWLFAFVSGRVEKL